MISEEDSVLNVSNPGEKERKHIEGRIDRLEAFAKMAMAVVSELRQKIQEPPVTGGGVVEQGNEASSPLENLEFYDLSLAKVQTLCADSPKTADNLIEALQLNKTQLNAWLKRAVADEKLKKLSRPVRYQWITTSQDTLPIGSLHRRGV